MGAAGWRVVVAGAVLGAVVTGVAEPGNAAPASVAPVRGTPDSGPATDPAVASALARRTGQRVEVDALGTETDQVFAEPDGTFTAELTAQPTRVRRGSGWVPVDTSLRLDGAGVAPGATEVGLRFSGGGSAPLAAMSAGEQSADPWSLVLSWPGALPQPSLAGNAATYPDVLPGVDLVVLADADGFAERLVVRSAAAAANPELAQIAFQLAGTGVSVRADATGALSGVDGTGTEVVSAPPPVMWDASGTQRPVGLTLQGEDLVLHPDLGLLTGAGTAFPVTIDPSFAAKRLNWAQVLSGWPGTAYWNGANLDDPTDPNGPVMVGLDPFYGDVARGFFQMGTSSVNGKHILKATFQITEKWANNCTASPVELWETGGIGTGTTWNNQPSWNKRLATANVAKGNENFGCGDGEVDFDATAAVVDAAKAGWPNLTLGLRATNEGTTSQWKRFDTNPTIAINYNSVPNQPSGLTVEGKGCVTGSGRPFVGTVTPTLRATVSDPDAGSLLNTSFYWAPVGGSTNGTDKVTQNSVATGSQAVVSVPAGKLADGSSYFFQVQDTDGIDTSPWSAQCEFTVDTTRPDHPPAVSSTDYPADGNFHGGVGQTGSFTLAAGGVADVAAYQYGWADPPTTQVAADALGGTATIAATPPAQGLNTLFVRSVDRAGNLSDISTYEFLAGGPTGPVGWWKSDEGSGTALGDAAGGGHPASLAGTTSWTNGRLGGADRAVSYDGATGYAETTAPVLHTDRSFTVAAWVVLGTANASGWHAAVTQNGPGASAFGLSYSGSAWTFAVHGMDTAGNATTTNVIAPSAPTTQAWVHLAGVYDAGSHQARLYVDGQLVASADNVTPFDARSTVDIGRERWANAWTDYWPGQVDDVRLWQRVVYPDELAKIADGPALVGQWDMDEGAGTTAGDATGYHPATLSGGYAWTSGFNGLGAVNFNGTSGTAAVTAGQVVHTNASFSVAAWVRLTDNSTYRGVLSEDGVTDSGFQLQYNPTCTCWQALMPLTDTTGPSTAAVRGPSGAAVGVWTHLVFVFDAATNTLRLYINGSLAATAAGPTAPLWDASGAFAIGRTQWNGAANSWFAGDIDNVRAYEGALSDADVADLVNQ